MSSSKLNVLCFVTDQHRADHLGCSGNNEVQTPNIDRIAEEGVVFTRSFVANPVCMPNRATMFTGRYPKAHGLRENGLVLSETEPILPGILRAEGYQTASFGKIHLSPFQMKKEFAEGKYDMLESHDYWDENDDLELPFRGFEHVYYVGGHVDYTFGHYKHWLEEEHPGMHEKMDIDHALLPPTGARTSWKLSIPEELHYNTKIADETIEFLKTCDHDRPFFVWCSFPDPHFPFAAPRPYCDQYDADEITFSPARREGELDLLPPYFRDSYEGKGEFGVWLGDVCNIADEHYREMLAHTYGMISMVDRNIGRVMRALEELALAERTIVVFMSDHGELLGDHWLIYKGPFLFDGLVRVPTVWRLPEGGDAGRKNAGPISTVDFCPTILDLLDIPAHDGVQGVSYKQVLRGEKQEIRDSVYVEFDTTLYHQRLRQLRTTDWAITYHPGKDYGTLFHLRDDPDELYNLWDDADYQKVKGELLVELLEETSLADNWLPQTTINA
jgi:arylsulfatase A-like enzyme